MTNACPDEEQISAYVDGLLAPEPREAMERHIDTCSSCSQVVSELVRIFQSKAPASEEPPGWSAPQRPVGDLRPSATHDDGMLTMYESEDDESDEQDEMTFPAGASVGRYRVLECVGMGGMGVVYAAYDPELDRRVALKVLRAGGEGGAAERRNARLLREAQAIARLSHPNVVTVHDVGRVQGRVFLAMEFVDGQTLTQWLHSETRSWEEIRAVFVAAARGLQAAHDAGLIHRDFKPDNLLIGRDGRAKVTDFGLARWDEEQLAGTPIAPDRSDEWRDPVMVTLTRTGALVGTPAYMAPEQYLRRPVTPASDQFSFCVALFEALYGVRPFAGQTLPELGSNVTSGRIRSVQEGTVPAEIRRVVIRGLSLEPGDRFPSMRDLIEALDDRSRKGRSYRFGLSLLIVAIATAATAYGVMRTYSIVPRRSACHGDPSLSSLWSERSKRAVEAAYLATGEVYAQESAQRVVEHLDDYSKAWNLAHQTVCELLDAGETSSWKAERQRRCLFGLRERFGVVLELLEAGGDAVAKKGAAMVETIGDPELCHTDERSEFLTLRLPNEYQSMVKPIRERITQAEVLRIADRHEDASKASAEAVAMVEAAEFDLGDYYLPILAEALEADGLARQAVDDHEAKRQLELAVLTANEARYRRLQVLTNLDLARLETTKTHDYERAHWWKNVAASQLESSGRDQDHDLLRQLRVTTGQLAIKESNFELALELFESVIREDKRRGDLQSLAHAQAMVDLGTAAFGANRREQGAAAMKEAVVILGKIYGDQHPEVARLHYNSGIDALAGGRFCEAIASFDRVPAQSDAKSEAEFLRALSVYRHATLAEKQRCEGVGLRGAQQGLIQAKAILSDKLINVHERVYFRTLLVGMLVEQALLRGKNESSFGEASHQLELAEAELMELKHNSRTNEDANEGLLYVEKARYQLAQLQLGSRHGGGARERKIAEIRDNLSMAETLGGAEELECRIIHPLVDELRAQLALVTGARDEAVRRAQSAIDRFEVLGESGDVLRVRQWLRRAGISARRAVDESNHDLQ